MSQAKATNRGCVSCEDAFTTFAMSLPVCFERKASQIIFIFSLRPHRVESFMTTAQFLAKWLILVKLLHWCGRLNIIINDNCDKLNYMGFTTMETILCNGCLALSEFLFKRMGVRYTTFINCIFPTHCISSMKGLCHVNINLIGMLMQFLLDFYNLYFHRCGLLILLKTNITYWLIHLRCHMQAQGLLQ